MPLHSLEHSASLGSAAEDSNEEADEFQAEIDDVSEEDGDWDSGLLWPFSFMCIKEKQRFIEKLEKRRNGLLGIT